MRRAILIAATVILSGCSGDLFSFGDDDTAEPVQQPVVAQVTSPVVANDEFCRKVAAQDAMNHGFDQTTAVKVATHSYQQCMSIYAR